ncbi:15131_t:CDS:2 [Gigaspora margarita]|uniref:15131_t:CDS:1 n=1 Tax=Gigaspora margarita TaxID=4874 RepID=A0ABN7UTY1_GIGMA|nr:15131_t:CDS:2 [Gigaspora margarita]
MAYMKLKQPDGSFMVKLISGLEAHGRYAFYGLAAMKILVKTDLLDVPSLFRWASSLQMQLEGGFQGRPNKLVDELDEYIEAFQEYLLIACQHHKGGLIDKSKRSPDYYHTCYCLSSLLISQHHVIYDFEKAAFLNRSLNAGDRYLLWSEDETKF